MTHSPKKVLVVFGTRPEAIKLAPVVRSLEDRPSRFCCRICVTGQHRRLLEQVLSTFGITPDYDLQVMEDGQEPSEVRNRCQSRLRPVLERERPDWVLVQGDTSTTVAASLAASYWGIPVGHVEAGLRTGNHLQPFPEEMHRRMTSRLSTLHFAPTESARQNLLREGVSDLFVYVTGNTVIDALDHVRRVLHRCPSRMAILDHWNGKRPLLLITSHRRESFGNGLEQICRGLREIARRGDADLIFPVHLNPRVRKPVRDLLGNLPNVRLIEPLDYVLFVELMQRAYLILTDSGGIQEEAPVLGKPVLVMRELTERPEGLCAGTAKLVGTDPAKILEETARLLDDPEAYGRMSRIRALYGDGQASARIADALECQTI